MFNKGNMAKMLKQAQEVQKQIENVQNELDDLNIEGESGGGMVKATVNGCLLYTSDAADEEDV